LHANPHEFAAFRIVPRLARACAKARGAMLLKKIFAKFFGACGAPIARSFGWTKAARKASAQNISGAAPELSFAREQPRHG